jgi:3',5'-cyclic AMP phosphodiesterase CpdA
MDFEVKPMAMISGSHEAEIRTYRKYECKRGVWLAALQGAPADNLYFHDPRDKNSDGFGGRTLRFPLEDGSVYEAKGPWKGNADSMFRDTGVDLRDQYSSFVVIGKGVRFEKGRYESIRVITDVVYMDDGFQIGPFQREEAIVKTLPVGKYQYYRETRGGSIAGSIEHKAA